jgi:hypothetical protein
MYSRLTSFIPTGYVHYKNMNNKITNNITFDETNPPPLTVSCATSGDEGPSVYIQTKDRTNNQKTKNNHFLVQIIIPWAVKYSAVYVG